MLVAGVDISQSLQEGLNDLIGFIPKLIGFLIILLIGYLVAKALQKVVALALEKVGTDKALRSGTTGEYVNRVAPDTSPSRLIGTVVFWFILLGQIRYSIEGLPTFVADQVSDSPTNCLSPTPDFSQLRFSPAPSLF